MQAHNCAMKTYDYPLYRALRKYGEINEFYILEEIPGDNRELLGEREKYWIEYYNTTDSKFGYNISEGGDGLHLSGSQSGSAKLIDKEIDQIINLLENSELTYGQIAEKFNINLTTIYHINHGQSYKIKGREYPIRNKEQINNIKTKSMRKLDDSIDEIINLLLNSDLKMTEIGKKFNINRKEVGKINQGIIYKNENYDYPLRSDEREYQISHFNKNDPRIISKENINKVIYLLQNTNLSYKEIHELNKDWIQSKITVSKINNGNYANCPKDIEYPIRKHNKGATSNINNHNSKITKRQLEEICNLLENSNKSMLEIGKEYNVSSAVISNINNGKTYKDKNKEYPIRKKRAKRKALEM